MKRRGISELISVVLVIIIVLSGMGVYTFVSQQRILGDALSVKEAITLSEQRLSELVEHAGMYRTRTSVDYVGTHLFNYGTKDIVITAVYINGTERVVSPATWYVRDLTGALNHSSIIPHGTLVELILNFTNSPNPPDQVKNIIVYTESKKFIELLNKTK
ncbi:MAG TPA: hypothetical protein VNK44_08020 [Candidatus Nitrosotenuis sp.]|nr:hypothetical protein [Candidatus Nitrosotenuis sp.]